MPGFDSRYFTARLRYPRMQLDILHQVIAWRKANEPRLWQHLTKLYQTLRMHGAKP